MADSKEIIRVFRSYNKEKGWPMAHEAADLIETLEAKFEASQAGYKTLLELLEQTSKQQLDRIEALDTRNAVLETHLDTIYEVMSGMPFDTDECFGAPRP